MKKKSFFLRILLPDTEEDTDITGTIGDSYRVDVFLAWTAVGGDGRLVRRHHRRRRRQTEQPHKHFLCNAHIHETLTDLCHFGGFLTL